MAKASKSPTAVSVVFGRSILSASFRISLLLHASLVAFLLLLTSRPPIFSGTPLKVQILEEPAPQPAPLPAPGSRQPQSPERAPLARIRPPAPAMKGEVPTERFVPRPVPSPDRPLPPAPAPPAALPPQAIARPAPEVPPPPPRSASRVPEPPRAVPREPPPTVVPTDRPGLALGSPRQWPPSPGSGAAGSSESRPARPSIRDQIASLGTGLTGEADAKHTINLDDREPQYVDWLGRLKRRIQREWSYPEEAQALGLSGELLLIFTVNKGGTLLNLRLVQSSGFPVLDNEAMRAVRAAAPYDPIPPGMGDESWNIRASFVYLGPGRGRRY